jgi:uncharacterized membrane protein YphA (DoxX/SURF4 family)
MAYDSMDRPRYLVPTLGNVYTALEVYSWPLVRAATGSFFMPHGIQKLFGLWDGNSQNYRKFCQTRTDPVPVLGLLHWLPRILRRDLPDPRPVDDAGASLFAGFMFVATCHV